MASPFHGMRLSVEDEITIRVHRVLSQDPVTRAAFGNAIYRRHLVIPQLVGAPQQVLVCGVQVDERLGFHLVKGEHAVEMYACAEWFQESLNGDEPSFATLLAHWRTIIERELNPGLRLKELTGTTKDVRWETVILAPESVDGSKTFLAAGQRLIVPYDVTAIERRRRAEAA